MQSRLLRFAMLVGLSALGACAQDPKTSVPFSVTATGPVDAGGGPPPDAMMMMTNVDAQTADGGTSGCGMDPGQNIGTFLAYHLSVSGPDLDASNKPLKASGVDMDSVTTLPGGTVTFFSIGGLNGRVPS